MTPSPNRDMQQRDMRPSAPINPYQRYNQPGAQVNQNGQISPSMGPYFRPAVPQNNGLSEPSPGMMGQDQGAPQNRYQTGPAIEPMGQAPPSAPSGEMGGASPVPPPGMGQAPMPAAARQNTNGPMPPPQPYTRQNMPQQNQLNRRIAPKVT